MAAWYDSPLLPWVIIGFGVLFRVAHYLHNPSLWVDEAALAISIVNRPFSELVGYLDYHTGAPVGFLWFEKWAVETLGNHEYALRLLPLLAGIGSLFLLYPLARAFIAPRAVPIVLILFASSTSLVRYSNLVKQYSLDVFLTLLLLLITLQVVKKNYAVKWLILYALAGAIALWFSFPIVFVMAGAGVVLGWQTLRSRRWGTSVQLGMVGAVWLASFAISLQPGSTPELLEEGIVETVSGNFAPIPPRSLGDARWFLDTGFEFFDVPGGIALTGLAALAFLLGCLSLWRTDRDRVLLLVLPILVTLLVSGAQLYPFTDRFVLFLTPLVLLLVAEGAAFTVTKTRETYSAIGIALVAIMLVHPISSEFFRLMEPRGTEEVRPVLEYINTHRQDGDQLYVYPGANKAFNYYADRFQIAEDQYVRGRAGDETSSSRLDLIIEDVHRLRGNDRVWFLFSNVKNRDFGLRSGGNINEESFYLYQINKVGTRLDQFRVHRAVAYLYDLNPAREPQTGSEVP